MFKKILSIALSLTLLLSGMAFAPSAKAYTNSNWMGSISDNTCLTQISIPGTHDSGARKEPVYGTAKCQNLSIGDQLNAGVRYLDIRCRHIDNAFTIHHGVVYQDLNFDNVLNACTSFLNANPTETIIMSVKEEHNAENVTRSFEDTFRSYVDRDPNRWYLGNTIPNLGQVRGKIVLLRRFASSIGGIDAFMWADNTIFTNTDSGSNIKIQDHYKVGNNNNKWNEISAMYNEANNADPSWLFINYTSGYRSILGIPSITTVSNNINPKLKTFFQNNTHGKYGITAMDFANNEICSLIIATNF
ncbi:MAG: phosphatidylinositol-specific phospholipase C [Lachnospiraceae bacterium]|nr:phosphatidylinositol-specific phospholipase C [Lachnospiraceae bacterium]